MLKLNISMTKPIAIILGEPNSISSEIIFKSWIYKNKYKHKPFFIIGNFLNIYSRYKSKIILKVIIKLNFIYFVCIFKM